MSLESEFALSQMRVHPAETAAVLERLPVADTSELLASAPAEVVAGVLNRMTAPVAATLLEALPAPFAGQVVGWLPSDVGARYLRGVRAMQREELLEQVSEQRRRTLRALLPYPEGTAGSLMDPEVLSIAEDLTVRDAVELVRSAAERARYNVYVTDRDDRLTGVLNLREILMADANTRIDSIMNRNVVSIIASAPEAAVIDHPGWQRAHALPVADDQRVYLGAIRYVTLRRLEEKLRGARGSGADTGEALGELFWAGMNGMVDALAPPRRG